jgi:hypothetical protein
LRLLDQHLSIIVDRTIPVMTSDNIATMPRLSAAALAIMIGRGEGLHRGDPGLGGPVAARSQETPSPPAKQ